MKNKFGPFLFLWQVNLILRGKFLSYTSLTWKIYLVRYLQIQGRDGFANFKYAEPLMTLEIQADRCAFGEQFGKSF